MLQAYILYFDTEIMKIQAEVIELNVTSDNQDNEINTVLQSTGYDFYDYSNEIAIIVDDRGFEKANNPVFEIVSEFGDTSHLVGRLLFVRNVENEFSTDIGSLKENDVEYLREHLNIKLIGLTKGM